VWILGGLIGGATVWRTTGWWKIQILEFRAPQFLRAEAHFPEVFRPCYATAVNLVTNARVIHSTNRNATDAPIKVVLSHTK